MSRLWVVGGPNGAGKSTLIRRQEAHLINHEMPPVISPDAIAAEQRVSPQKAAQKALQQRWHMITSGQNVVLDTTFSGPSLPRLMADLKSCGWGISLIFVGTRDTLLLEQRIRQRVAAGEHDVPVQDIERRYQRSVKNLADHWKLADRLYVFDNTFAHPRLKLSAKSGTTTYVSRDLPGWIEGALPELIEAYRAASNGRKP